MKQKFNALYFPQDDKIGRIKSLDGFRGFAVIIVLLAHSSNDGLYFHESLVFKRFGFVGVYLFFVLSAYLLDRQITVSLRQGNVSMRYWKNYFLRRFLRVYPLFLLALIVFWIQNSLGFRTVINNLTDIPAHLVLLRGKGIFWSIAVEFKYYFISPLILVFFHRLLKWDIVKISLMTLVIIILSMVARHFANLTYVSTISFLPIFLIGTIISVFEVMHKNQIKRIYNSMLFNMLGVLVLIGILITNPFFFEKLFGFKPYFGSSIGSMIYGLFIGILLLSAKTENGIIKRILEFKFLRFLGVCSYSLYLFHMPVLAFLKQSKLPDELKIWVFFIATILLSSLTYLLIERPLSKINIPIHKHG